MSAKQLIFWLFLVLWCSTGLAQTQLKPSQRYNPGEAIYGAKTGVKTIIPDGWMGMLPRDTELFLLMPVDGSNGEIYVTRSEQISAEERKEYWMSGFDLGNGNILRSDGNFFERNGNIATNLKLNQNTSTNKGYLETVCGPYGVCLTVTLFSGAADTEKLKAVVYSLIDHITWQEPSKTGFYDDFNWNELLTGKHLLNHDYVPNAKMENDIWLCPDGKFTIKLKRSGLLKDQAKAYKGNKSGTWQTNSIGQTGELILNFEKLDPVKVKLYIEDDKIFLNEKRHFVLKATNCK